MHRARTGMLRSSEMSDPTITVTNLGDLGVDSVFGVIYPPQVALVGFGRIASSRGPTKACSACAPSSPPRSRPTIASATAIAAHSFLAALDRLLQSPGEAV